MATVTDLAIRALRKSNNLGAEETASAADLQLAVETVKAVHGYLKSKDLLRWTLNDIPQEAEMPYVLMTAFYLQSEFEQAQNASFWSLGLDQIMGIVALPAIGVTQAEYF